MADYVLELRLNYRADQQLATNVIHFLAVTTSPENDWTVANQLFDGTVRTSGVSSWMSKLRGCLSTDTHISMASARVIHPLGGNRVADGFTPTDLPGLGGSAAFNSETAGVLNFMSLTNPGKMGRLFMPGVPSGFMEGGRWNSTGTDTYDEFADELSNGFTEGGTVFTPVIWNQVTKTYRETYGIYLSGIIGQMSQRGRGE